MEYASLEEDESLQDIWSRLLANSLDSDRNFELKIVYIDIIKSITPLEAKILKFINDSMNNQLSGMAGLINLSDIQVSFHEICEEFPNVGWPINASIGNLMRVRCIENMGLYECIKKGSVGQRIEQTYTLTALGMDFISTCIEDKK